MTQKDDKSGKVYRQLYIVLSQTGTVLSRILKRITGAEYNHASISLTLDLQQMYSFGRRHPYNPFWGGFVVESPHAGTFKRFTNTNIVVLAVDISEEKYMALCGLLENMWLHRKQYHYNYLGLCLAAFHIKRSRDNCYYCSEFVRTILLECEVNGARQLQTIVHPVHFLSLPHTQVYHGKMSEYGQ